MIQIAQIAPMSRFPVRPPKSVVREAQPQSAVGSDSFGQGPMRRAANRRRRSKPYRDTRGKGPDAPPPLPEPQDAAPFLAQLLAQDVPKEQPADPFETATRAYEKPAEDPFGGLDEDTLDAVLVDPQIHVDVKI